MTDKTTEHIGSTELGNRTGATYRQIDYWCRGGVFNVINNDNTPGTGVHREFDVAIVPAVRLLVRVSACFHSSIRRDTLKIIFDNYESGVADFDGLTLSWEV